MTTTEDYYDILGVARNASASDIKKAYRRRAMKFHPDRNPGDKEAEAQFKKINEAYGILSNDSKRSAYDQFGHAGVDPSRGGAGAGGYGFQDMGDVFGDIFGDIFGGSRGAREQQAQRGSDLLYELVLNLEEAVRGVSKSIKVPTLVNCDVCTGTGAKKGSKPVKCPTCQGTGQMRIQHGFIAVQQTCSSCRGQGEVIRDPCQSCHGQGRIQKEKNLSVKIPAGVDNGDRVRLSGEGEAGATGAAAGDLYVQIRVREHPIFSREGNDLHTEVPISFITAILGGEIPVPTLNGQVKLTIPAETQSGKLFRLRGKGIKALRSGAVGDLICRIVAETPVKLNARQKEILREFEQELENDGKNHSPKAHTWFDSVKRFFG